MPRPSQHLYRPVQKAGVRFFIRFSTVFDTLYYGFEMVIFQKQRFFFVEIIFWSCRWLSKNIYSVFFLLFFLQFKHFYLLFIF
jgi:hypothetical protein